MKVQYRFGLFETNSSSSHTLTIMSDEEYQKFLSDAKNPDMIWDKDNDRYISVEEVVKRFDRFDSKNVDEKIVARMSDESKVIYMLEHHWEYCDSEYDCADIVTQKIDMPDGTRQWAVSVYTYED